MLSIRNGELRFGERELWHDLDIDVAPGEFIAILGPNGCGKTALLKTLLGENKLTTGTASIGGHEVRRGDPDVGYVPQQRGVDRHTPLRARDLVRLGLDGHRFGFGLPNPGKTRRVNELLRQVGAEEYADSPIGFLSGGELQRLRLAQALASDPKLLLCDEPLLSLDLTHQNMVAALLDEKRRERDMAILFVTHEINPILPYVNRVLYIAGGHFLVGPPDEVMTTEALTELFGSRVEVVTVGGQLVVVGSNVDHHHPKDGPL